MKATAAAVSHRGGRFVGRPRRMRIPFYHYWLANGRLLGSENPSLLPRSAELVSAIARAHGIHALLSLDADVPAYRIDGLHHVRLPLSNRCVPTPAQLREAVELVAIHLRHGKPLWCHCRHGIDRTGAVLGAALAATGQAPDAIIAELIAHFPPSRRTPDLLALWQPYADLIRAFAAPPDFFPARRLDTDELPRES